MYKELRIYANTSDAWAEPFLKSDVGWMNAISSARLRVTPEWRAIHRHVPPGGHILDAGCGMGRWPAFLVKNGYRVTGLDFSDRMIALLNERYAGHDGLSWVHGAVQQIPLPENTFDAVISWGVIEHDEAGPEAALREFYRVLKPGGKAILTVPIDSPEHRRSSLLQFDEPGAETFFQYFMSPAEFEGFIEGAGFRVLDRARPASRHYAVVFPDRYVSLQRRPTVMARLAGGLLNVVAALPIANRRRRSANLMLAVAEKPR